MPADTVVLSGDIHMSMAAELPDAAGAPVAVELTTPSLTSQNLDEKLRVAPRDPVILESEAAFTDALEPTQWCEMASHGYVVIDVDCERVRGEWWLLDTVLEPSDTIACAAAFDVPRGAARLEPAGGYAHGSTTTDGCPAPLSTSTSTARSSVAVIGSSPVPGLRA
jgi:alkaline phosphatase D